MNQSSGNDDPSSPRSADNWLDAREAAELLGVKRETLYAYVSRGRVESRSDGSGRRRTYRRADLERLRASKDARSGHRAVAAGALRWGEPVLDSAITRIDASGPLYRGRSSVQLADDGVAFERVADLLLVGALGEPGGADAAWSTPSPPRPWSKLAGLLSTDARPLDAAMLAVPVLGMRDTARLVAGPVAQLGVARRVVRGLAASFGVLRSAAHARAAVGAKSIAATLAAAFGIRAGRRTLRAINQGLVICADHELNASSFACRVAASAGADLYACTSAALATLSGPHHGGLSERVEALCDEIGSPGHTTRAVRARLRRGDAIPGFGHPLYPRGDPRAAPLFRAARDVSRSNERVQILEALVDTMDLVDGGGPTLDVGLVALSSALRLPRGAATALFAAGRCAGWLAHAIEQREAGFLLRPRARYVGE